MEFFVIHLAVPKTTHYDVNGNFVMRLGPKARPKKFIWKSVNVNFEGYFLGFYFRKNLKFVCSHIDAV